MSILKQKLNTSFFVIAFVLLCVSCSEERSSVRENKTVSNHLSAKAHKDYRKPGANVFLLRPAINDLALGEQKQLTYRLRSGSAQGRLILRIHSDNENLQLLSPQYHEFDITSEAAEIVLDVSVVAEGMGQLNFHAEFEGQTRAFSHRFQLGSPSNAKSAAKTAQSKAVILQKTEQGRSVRIMNAKETLIQQ